MRRKLTFVVPAIGVLAWAGCESVLDTAPYGELNSESFYNNEADFEKATIGPYSTLLNFYYNAYGPENVLRPTLYPDDDTRHGGTGGNNYVDFNWLPGDFGYHWQQSYKGILRANVVIDQLGKATGFRNDSNKARFEAEARFMRAYLYFFLARHFGNVPVITSPATSIEETRVGNSAPGEVWDLIEQDLEFAAANLPAKWPADNVGRADRFDALGFLGKVELYRAQWFKNPAKYTEAIQHLNTVVNEGGFMLVDDYGDNFREDKENNAESLFEIQFAYNAATGNNPWLPNDFGLAGNQNVGSSATARIAASAPACVQGSCAPGANDRGIGAFHVATELQGLFDSVVVDGDTLYDPRRYYSIYSAGEPYLNTTYKPSWSITGATPAKYVRQSISFDSPRPIAHGNNERVLRYADILLLLAEAELLGANNTARATELVNQVRARARKTYQIVNGSPAPAGLLENRTSVTFEQLMHERRVELAFEGNRYDDLVRWHRAGLINIKTDVTFPTALAQANWDERNLLWPISQGEIDNNPGLVQNPGYN